MNELVIKREKSAARELRKSRWWQTKIAASPKCHYCLKPLKKDECTMDHVVPIVRGGRSTKGNVVISCKDCNNKKKDRLVMEWSVVPGDMTEVPGSHAAGSHKQADETQK